MVLARAVCEYACAMRWRSAACAMVTAALAIPAAAGGASHGRATCAHQSEASFPGAYTSARNLRVGPLVLVGGHTYTSPETMRRFGGQKYPALVAAGHTVKLALSPGARRTHSLTYADAIHGTRRLEDGVRVVTFKACGQRRAASDASGRAVTFWSGSILAGAPACLRVRVWIDGARTARRARIPLGRRC
jgi:hypothetical protein